MPCFRGHLRIRTTYKVILSLEIHFQRLPSYSKVKSWVLASSNLNRFKGHLIYSGKAPRAKHLTLSYLHAFKMCAHMSSLMPACTSAHFTLMQVENSLWQSLHSFHSGSAWTWTQVVRLSKFLYPLSHFSGPYWMLLVHSVFTRSSRLPQKTECLCGWPWEPRWNHSQRNRIFMSKEGLSHLTTERVNSYNHTLSLLYLHCTVTNQHHALMLSVLDIVLWYFWVFFFNSFSFVPRLTNNKNTVLHGKHMDAYQYLS